MNLQYHCGGNPAAYEGQTVKGDCYRFTVLTNRMIRCEYSEAGEFVDERTQMVMNRQLDHTPFEVKDSGEELTIETDMLCLIYDKKEFSQDGLRVRMRANPYTGYAVWYYGTQGDVLPGTARTLDRADGEILLEPGVLSKNGYSFIDDSDSFRLDSEGWVMPAQKGHKDIYFIAYGREYTECLRDYYRLTGDTPLLPRFTLGNWWSRYYEYTQEEYLALMDRFDEERLPFSVSVIDMDWHLVKIPEKYGKGWTGYTWNKELFPDHRALLKDLHDRGKKVTLNVHPADGIRAYEDKYPAAAARMGVDQEKEEPVEFDIADRRFLETYFECVHHPMEEEGVDFWWIDWQQGSRSGTAGLDPLWMLNHYHFLDSMRGGNSPSLTFGGMSGKSPSLSFGGMSGKRPLTFSRYAGLGSHRYPIGFSGDTVISWESLDFQPYFTSMASNAGYGWWSHDIGGHMDGYRDDELTARWVEYGVFSPIMRLHSTKNEFSGKEPWKYRGEVRELMGEFLRLRHQLIPYLYTMNYRSFADRQPLVWPLYYRYPETEKAYEFKNEYFFGSELLVNPITTPINKASGLGMVKTWLPEGVWFDFFDGLIYHGGRTIMMSRPIDRIPVLARAGGIVPMEAEETVSARTENPEFLEVRIFAGADGVFTLYEDDGKTLGYEDGASVRTEFRLDWENGKFTVGAANGDVSLIPKQRKYRLVFYGLTEEVLEDSCVWIGKEEVPVEKAYDEHRTVLTMVIPEADVKKIITVKLTGSKGTGENLSAHADSENESGTESGAVTGAKAQSGALILAENRVKARCYELLNRAQIGYNIKNYIYDLIKIDSKRECLLSEIQSADMDDRVKTALLEILFAS